VQEALSIFLRIDNLIEAVQVQGGLIDVFQVQDDLSRSFF